MNIKINRIVSLVLTLCLLLSCTVTLASCNLGGLELQSVSVDLTTIVTEYTVGDEVDLSGIKVTARYNDTTQTKRVGFDDLKFEFDGKEITDFSVLTESAGEKVLTVKYYDDVATKKWQSATVTISVKALILPEFVSMTLRADSVPAQLCVGDRVDFTGILVDVDYENHDDVVATFSQLTLEYEENLTASEGVKTVVVKYYDGIADEEEKSTSFTVTVGAPTFASFTAAGAPTECYIGEAVDFSSVLFTLTYEEGSAYEKTVPGSVVIFSALDTATAGVKTVSATYTDIYGFDRSTALTVTVKNPEKVGLSIEASTITTRYGVGDAADFDEILAHATYAQESFNRDLHFSDLTFKVDGEGALTDLTAVEGDKVVTVSYTDAYGNAFSTTVNVKVELRFVSFTVVPSSVKVDYYKDDDFDFSGLQAEIRYNNASYNKTLSGDALTVSGTENLTATTGEKTVTVTYEDPKFDGTVRTATFKVSVAADGFKSVTLVTTGVKNEYAIGDAIDLSGLKFTVDYENDLLDGTFDYTDARITLSSLEGLTASAGEKTIEVTFNDGEGTVKTLEYKITVKAPVYQSASVNLNGFVTSYKFGETIPAYTAITVSTLYDNTYCNGTLANESLTFTGTVNLKLSGTYPITVSFKDYNGASRSTSFNITVTAPVYDGTNTAIDMNGVKNAYYVTDTPDDFAAVKVNVVYDLSDYNETLSGASLTVDSSKVDMTKAGSYLVTVKFTDKLGAEHTITYTVTVTAPALKKAEATVGKDIYKKGDTVDFSDLKVTLTYDPADYSKVLTSGLTYNVTEITASNGNKNVEISYVDPYTGNTAKVYVALTVASGKVDPFEAPDSLKLRNSNVANAGKAAYGEAGFEGQFFAGQDTTYYIGDDNPFVFEPAFALFDENEQQITDATVIIDTAIKLDGETLTKKKGTASNTYDYFNGETLIVTANLSKYSYQFTSAAVGKTVSLSLTPSTSLYTFSGSPISLTAKVIDAYNVYTGADLCVIDNQPAVNHGFEEYGTNQWWDEFKEQKGYAGISVNGVVFQNDITLKTSDLPDSFFAVSTAEITTSDGTVFPAGSKFLKDGLDIYMRVMDSGNSFAIEGNFFTLDAEKFPTVPSTGMKDSIANGVYYESDFSNTTLFRFKGNAWAGIDKTTFSVSCDLRNLNIKGNANRNENQDKDGYLVSAGGLILAKNTNCVTTYTNVICKCFFITYFPDDFGYDYTDASVANVNYCKCFDSFQNSAFIWGHAALNVNNSYIQRAGGPLAILQHVEPKDNPTSRIPKLVANNSVLESYVDASAFWFSTVGATETAGMIAALSAVVNGYGLGTYVNGNNKMNMVALLMCNGSNVTETVSNTATAGSVSITGNGQTTLLDRTANSALGQTLQYLYATQPALAAAPILSVGDGSSANPLTFVNQIEQNYYLFTPEPLGELSQNANFMAYYLPTYQASPYIAMSYGGFGIMFGFQH